MRESRPGERERLVWRDRMQRRKVRRNRLIDKN